ncbi:uncharacterized protein [Oscarella lobularis]|uniref:uncharacterized protein n=1 Tax=Oscarella lobularis TaxID=121494 RepID=UPI0033134DCF
MGKTIFFRVHPVVVYAATPFVVTALYVAAVLYFDASSRIATGKEAHTSAARRKNSENLRRLFETQKNAPPASEHDALAFVLADDVAKRTSAFALVRPMRFLLLQVPSTLSAEFFDAFVANARLYNNVSWCRNEPWRRPTPRLDHVCERTSESVAVAADQVAIAFGGDGDGVSQCDGLRMNWDYSLVDEKLVLSRKTFRLVTVLRHPVNRLVNAYRDGGARRVVSLREFAVSEALHFQKYGSRNHQVRQFAGVLQRCSLYGAEAAAEARRDLLATAKRNLRDFDAIGIRERMNDTLRLFRRLFSWKSDSAESLALEQAVAALRDTSDVHFVSEGDFDFLLRENQLEVELYSFAVELFEKQLEMMDLNDH